MDELELLRELRDDSPADEARERARLDLDGRMRAAARRPRRRRRWAFGAAGLAAAGAIAIVIALVTGVDDASIGPAPATAKQALERAAKAAEANPEPLLGAGEYFYVRERSAYLGITQTGNGEQIGTTTNYTEPAGWSVISPSERETWTDREGRGRFVVHDSDAQPTFPGPRDRAAWVAAGRPDTGNPLPSRSMRIGGPGGFTTGATSLTYEQLAALPSDGEAMYRRLIELAGDAGPSPDEEAFTIIADLLRSAPVPASARAGLYRAAGHIKGVRYVGEVRDELGRAGLAVELEEKFQRRRLVFDPDTSQMLVEQEVLTKRVPYIDADPGFVTGYRIVLEQGVVKSTTARP